MKNYKEIFQNIINNCKNESDYKFVEDCIDSIKNYYSSVVSFGLIRAVLSEKESGSDEEQGELSEVVNGLPAAYEKAVESINSLNSFCEERNIEKPADINTEDRASTELFIGEFFKEIIKGS